MSDQQNNSFYQKGKSYVLRRGKGFFSDLCMLGYNTILLGRLFFTRNHLVTMGTLMCTRYGMIKYAENHLTEITVNGTNGQIYNLGSNVYKNWLSLVFNLKEFLADGNSYYYSNICHQLKHLGVFALGGYILTKTVILMVEHRESIISKIEDIFAQINPFHICSCSLDDITENSDNHKED